MVGASCGYYGSEKLHFGLDTFYVVKRIRGSGIVSFHYYKLAFKRKKRP